MNKVIMFLSAALFTATIWAQSPEKMTYQAVVRDADNELLSNQEVGMQISILKGPAMTTEVYTETQTPTTNANGLISIEIGNETGFDAIDWGNDSYFIKTEIDPGGGNNYSISGTSQLLSVPYALHAKTAERVSDPVAETDPVYATSVASGISAADTTKWNSNSGSITETDPVFESSLASKMNASDTALWNNKLDTEADGDTTNELQTLSFSDGDLSISDGNTVSIPASPWKLNGSDVYYNTGLIGLGVSAPTALFDVYDDVGYNFFNFESEDNVYTRWISNRIGVDDYQIGIDGGNNKFIFANLTTSKFPFVMHGTNVGLGTLNPEAPLHVNDFMKLEPRTTAPSSPTKGVIYYDDNDNKIKVYTGSGWENLN